MKSGSVYFGIAAIVAVIIGAYWCFTSGPCQSGSSSNFPTAITGAINSALSSNEQTTADAGGVLGDLEQGSIFSAVQSSVDNVLNSIFGDVNSD